MKTLKVTDILKPAAATILLIFAGCMKEDAGTFELRTISIDRNYCSVSISSAIEVTYSDQTGMMQVNAQQNVHNYIDIQEMDGRLEIDIRHNNLSGTKPVSIILPSSPNLSEVDLSGACLFAGEVPVICSNFKLDLDGASYFRGTVYADNHSDIELSGASGANIAGSVPSCTINVSGASMLDGYNGSYFTSDNVQCEISGASDATFESDGVISGEVSGASHLTFIGNAQNRLEVTGDSKVTHK